MTDTRHEHTGGGCEDYYLGMLRSEKSEQLLNDLRFMNFVIQFDLHRVFEAIEPKNFPEVCMHTAMRHRRTEMFHQLFVHSRAHAELETNGLRAGQLLLAACREGAVGAVEVLLRYRGVRKTTMEDGMNCVHHLLSHRLYMLMDHFLDTPEVWTTDILVHLVFHSHTYFVRELIRRNLVPDISPLLELAHAPVMRAILRHELNERNKRMPGQALHGSDGLRQSGSPAVDEDGRANPVADNLHGLNRDSELE